MLNLIQHLHQKFVQIPKRVRNDMLYSFHFFRLKICGRFVVLSEKILPENLN